MAVHPGLRIGVTGGIGSGKSTVAGMLEQHGATLIDTDAIARSLTLPGGAAIESIRTAFGTESIDATGAVDRTRMRVLVFQNTSAKDRLEAILHPMIRAECQRQAQGATGHVVFDIPLLVESGRWAAELDRIVVVDCSEISQIERVVQRSGWTLDAVRAVIAQQATRTARRAAADAVIVNEGLTLEQLANEVDMLWPRWTRVEQSRRSSGARPS